MFYLLPFSLLNCSKLDREPFDQGERVKFPFLLPISPLIKEFPYQC